MAKARARKDISTEVVPNGAGMAAILAAGIGCAALGIFDFLADAFPSIGHFFNFYAPSGALSGVTDTAIVVWLGSWYVLAKRWRGRNIVLGHCFLAFALLFMGVLFTFPPFIDLLQGK
jgi:hypothetical protein